MADAVACDQRRALGGRCGGERQVEGRRREAADPPRSVGPTRTWGDVVRGRPRRTRPPVGGPRRRHDERAGLLIYSAALYISHACSHIVLPVERRVSTSLFGVPLALHPLALPRCLAHSQRAPLLLSQAVSLSAALLPSLARPLASLARPLSSSFVVSLSL